MENNGRFEGSAAESSSIMNGNGQLRRGQNVRISNAPPLGVSVTSNVSIVIRNPLPPPPQGGPPPPAFSRVTRARILHLLAAQRVDGDYDHILQATARMIAELHRDLIHENIITIPQSHRIYVIQYNEDQSAHVSAEEDYHVRIETDMEVGGEQAGNQIVFYAVSPEVEINGDHATFTDLIDDDLTLEELLSLEAVYGLPDFVVRRQLRSEEYRLAPGTQSQDSCRICLELLADGDRTAKLNCDDKFHYDCISQWLTIKNVCPLCRRTGIYP